MIQLHSFLWLSNIPLYIYIHHIFLIHSSVNGHLGCFHTLAIVNSVFLRHSLSNPFQEIVCNSPASLVASVRNPIEKSQTKEGVYRFMIPYVRGNWVGLRQGDVWSKDWGCAPTVHWPFQETSLFHILTPHIVLPGSINMAANTPNPTFRPRCTKWGNEQTVSLIPLLWLAPKGSGTS